MTNKDYFFEQFEAQERHCHGKVASINSTDEEFFLSSDPRALRDLAYNDGSDSSFLEFLYNLTRYLKYGSMTTFDYMLKDECDSIHIYEIEKILKLYELFVGYAGDEFTECGREALDYLRDEAFLK